MFDATWHDQKDSGESTKAHRSRNAAQQHRFVVVKTLTTWKTQIMPASWVVSQTKWARKESLKGYHQVHDSRFAHFANVFVTKSLPPSLVDGSLESWKKQSKIVTSAVGLQDPHEIFRAAKRWLTDWWTPHLRSVLRNAGISMYWTQ